MSHLDHNSVALSQETLQRGPSSRQSNLWVEAELGAHFGDRDYAILIRDIVDAGAARQREQRSLCGSIDVQSRLTGRLLVPSARSIEEAIAQDDGIETGREHLLLHIGGAFDRNRPRRIGQIERIGLGMRPAASPIAKRDALYDEAPRPARLRRGNEVARAFGADAGILCIGRGDARVIEFAGQGGELMDHDLRLGGTHRRADRWRVEDVDHRGSDPGPLEFFRLLGRARGAGDLVPGAQEEWRQPPTDRTTGARKKYSHQRITTHCRPREDPVAGAAITDSGIWSSLSRGQQFDAEPINP